MKKLLIAGLMAMSVSAYANTDLIDCNKVATLSSELVYGLSQGSGISYTLKALTEASRGIVMSEAEHIVATGIVSNVYSLGYKKFYEQIGVSRESYERKKQASKNVFYMFCKESFKARKFY